MSDLICKVLELIKSLLAQHIIIYLFIGLIIGFALFQLIIKNNYGIRTFLHESSHAVMAILFFRRIERFVSTSYQGGYVKHSGGFGDEGGNLIILLAPYFFPLLTSFSLILRSLFPAELIGLSTLITGICVSIDLQQNVVELMLNWHSSVFNLAGTNEYTQTDIARVGFLQSLVLIIVLSVFLYTLSIYICLNGFNNVPEFLNSIYSTLIDFIFIAAKFVIKYSRMLFNLLEGLLYKI